MSQFLNRLSVWPLDDGEHFELNDVFRFNDDVLDLITVPKLFVTDGGSIPVIFRNIISPTGKGFRAYVIHDWLYAIQICSKEDADKCLLRALAVCQFNALGEEVVYAAVRDGGQAAWNEDSKNVEYNRNLGGIHV